MKIRPFGAELFHADRETDRKTDMAKLIIVPTPSPPNSDISPKNEDMNITPNRGAGLIDRGQQRRNSRQKCRLCGTVHCPQLVNGIRVKCSWNRGLTQKMDWHFVSYYY